MLPFEHDLIQVVKKDRQRPTSNSIQDFDVENIFVKLQKSSEIFM